MDDILNRSIPSTSSNAFTKSKKVYFPLSPKSPMFTPVSTISLVPVSAMRFAFSTTFSTVSLLLAPRANGIVQKVHE